LAANLALVQFSRVTIFVPDVGGGSKALVKSVVCTRLNSACP
jgi:hypothetical protein